MDSGYLKVVIEEEVSKIMAFFTPYRNLRWKVMPMGSLNMAPKFVAMMMKLQMEWYTLAKECGLKNTASKIIVDGVLLYGRTARQIIAYFITVMDFLSHHRATLKLKRCKWFKYRCEFSGLDVTSGVT